MKKYLLFLVMLPLVFASCTKESSMNIDKEDSVYYVKYVAEPLFGEYEPIATYMNEKGEMVDFRNTIDKKREVIIGPVSYGFECKIETSNSRIAIYCSKNNFPFAFKAMGGPVATYTIDY